MTTRHRARRMTATQVERVTDEISRVESDGSTSFVGVVTGSTFVEGTAEQLDELAELVEFHVDDDHESEIRLSSMHDLTDALVERMVAKRVDSIKRTAAKLRTAAKRDVPTCGDLLHDGTACGRPLVDGRCPTLIANEIES